MNIIQKSGLGLGLALLLSCGDPTVGSRYIKSQDFDSQGGELVISREEAAEVEGARLSVPAGALSSKVKISVELAYENLVGDESAGPALAWGPAGTRFTVPARMTVPVKGVLATEEVSVFVMEADGSSFEIPSSVVQVTGGLAQFEVNGFTRFQPIRRARCNANNQCRVGQLCIGGACRTAADGGLVLSDGGFIGGSGGAGGYNDAGVANSNDGGFIGSNDGGYFDGGFTGSNDGGFGGRNDGGYFDGGFTGSNDGGFFGSNDGGYFDAGRL